MGSYSIAENSASLMLISSISAFVNVVRYSVRLGFGVAAM